MTKDAYDKSLVHFGTAPKATAGLIRQIKEGSLATYWCGKLRGQFVKSGPDWLRSSKEQALDDARRFRNESLIEAKAKGLITE